MQVYVQKLTTTTFPRRPSAVSGGELSQSFAPPSDGRCPSVGGEIPCAEHRKMVTERSVPRTPGH